MEQTIVSSWSLWRRWTHKGRNQQNNKTQEVWTNVDPEELQQEIPLTGFWGKLEPPGLPESGRGSTGRAAVCSILLTLQSSLAPNSAGKTDLPHNDIAIVLEDPNVNFLSFCVTSSSWYVWMLNTTYCFTFHCSVQKVLGCILYWVRELQLLRYCCNSWSQKQLNEASVDLWTKSVFKDVSDIFSPKVSLTETFGSHHFWGFTFWSRTLFLVVVLPRFAVVRHHALLLALLTCKHTSSSGEKLQVSRKFYNQKSSDLSGCVFLRDLPNFL